MPRIRRTRTNTWSCRVRSHDENVRRPNEGLDHPSSAPSYGKLSLWRAVCVTAFCCSAFFGGRSAFATQAPLAYVHVTCDGYDSVGASLCFDVKEAIISSGRYQLVDDMVGKIGVGVHLVSVDTSPPGPIKGLRSAVSVTYTFFGGQFEYYGDAQVFSVGSKRVADIASAISSKIASHVAQLNE